MRALLLALPLCLLAAPLAAQTAGQGGTGTNLLDPLGSRSVYPQGTVNPSLMPRPGGSTPTTSGSQAIVNPNGGLQSGAAAADGQQSQPGAGGARRGGGGGGGGGLAPGVTPVPGASGSGRASGGGSASAAFTATGGGSGRGGSTRGGANGGSSGTAAVPSGHAAQWVLCPGDDSEIAAELGGGMRCAP